MKLFAKQHYSQLQLMKSTKLFLEINVLQTISLVPENVVASGGSLHKQTHYLWEKIY